MKIYAYCWATGVIHFGTKVPEGAIAIARGERQAVVDFIEVVARHAYDGKTLLVPGVPEAEETKGDAAKGDALEAWLTWIGARSSKPAGIEVFGMEKR